MRARFLSYKDLAKVTGFSISQIRHWLKKRKINGLAKAVIQENCRSIFVDRVMFEQWAQHTNKQKSTRKPRRSKKKIVAIPAQCLAAECPTNPPCTFNPFQYSGEKNVEGIHTLAIPTNRTGFFRKIFERIFH